MTTIPASDIDIHEISIRFVREYYTLMSRQPSKLFHFYNKNSILLIGEEEEQGTLKCIGIDAIEKQFQLLDFQGSRVAISNVDSQASMDGGIIVMVIGQISLPSFTRKFVQNFFLARQPDGYYILNDILRFLIDSSISKNDKKIDDITSEIHSGQYQQTLKGKLENPAMPSSTCIPILTLDSITHSPIKTRSGNQDVRMENKMEENEHGAIAATLSSASNPQVMIPSGVMGTNMPFNQKLSVTNQDKPASSLHVSSIASSSKMSKDKFKQFTTTSTASSTKPLQSSSQTFTSSSGTIQSSMSASSFRTDDNKEGLGMETSIESSDANGNGKSSWAALAAGQSNKWGSGVVAQSKGSIVSSITPNIIGSANSNGSATLSSSSEPHVYRTANGSKNSSVESKTVFISRIKGDLITEELRAVFDRFGKIVSFEGIAPKGIAFVEYESVESANAAVAAISIYHNNQLVVEHKHPKPKGSRRHGRQDNRSSHSSFSSSSQSQSFQKEGWGQLLINMDPSLFYGYSSSNPHPSPSSNPHPSLPITQNNQQMGQNQQSQSNYYNYPTQGNMISNPQMNYPPPTNLHSMNHGSPSSNQSFQYQQYSPGVSSQMIHSGQVPPVPPIPQASIHHPSTPPRINPGLVPSVVAVQETDQIKFRDVQFRSTNMAEQNPPLTSTITQIIDDGNSSPRFVRSTLNHIPCTEELYLSSKIPLAILIRPFARMNSMELVNPVPLIDFGPDGPFRCQRCRAYINVYMIFGRGGRTVSCNICNMENNVREDYFCPLDPTGRRADLAQRPELLHGTIDMVATKEYEMNKSATSVHVIFALDVTRSAVQSGALLAAVEAIRLFLLNEHASIIYRKVAICCYDRSIHFFDLRTGFSEAHSIVMNDITEPFSPLSKNKVFIDLNNPISRELLTNLLESIPRIYSETKVIDSAFGAMMTVSLEMLKDIGGRVFVFQTSLPTIGIGLLKNRDSLSAGGMSGGAGNNNVQNSIDRPDPLLQPQGDFYVKLGQQASIAGVSYNMFLSPVGFVDFATTGHLVTKTNGHLELYDQVGTPSYRRKISTDLSHVLQKPFVYDAIVRVRCSGALQFQEIIGNCTTINQADYQFAHIDSDQSFAIKIGYEGKFNEQERVTIQCAVLYTTPEGQRRIRIFNLGLPTTNVIANVFRMSDVEALASFICKKSVTDLLDGGMSYVISQINQKVTQILIAYRKHCAHGMAPGQLVLPEALKLFPIFSLSLLKTGAFILNNHGGVDKRAFWLRFLTSVDSESLISILYPKLYSLHSLIESDFPKRERLSADYIDPKGIYLVENGIKAMLFIGSFVDPSLIQMLFGVDNANFINPDMVELPVLENVFSEKVRNFLEHLRRLMSKSITIQIVRHGIDPHETEWQQMLIEDEQPGNSSYVDYLVRMHGQIQHEMTSAPSFTERAAMLNFLH